MNAQQRIGSRKFTKAEIEELNKTDWTTVQADGRTVHIVESAQGGFNIMIRDAEGAVTYVRARSEDALANLANNYGWEGWNR